MWLSYNQWIALAFAFLPIWMILTVLLCIDKSLSTEERIVGSFVLTIVYYVLFIFINFAIAYWNLG